MALITSQGLPKHAGSHIHRHGVWPVYFKHAVPSLRLFFYPVPTAGALKHYSIKHSHELLLITYLWGTPLAPPSLLPAIGYKPRFKDFSVRGSQEIQDFFREIINLQVEEELSSKNLRSGLMKTLITVNKLASHNIIHQHIGKEFSVAATAVIPYDFVANEGVDLIV